MDFIRHMAPELLLALFLVCMSGALVAAAYITLAVEHSRQLPQATAQSDFYKEETP